MYIDKFDDARTERLKATFLEGCRQWKAQGLGKVALSATQTATVAYLRSEAAYSFSIGENLVDDYGRAITIWKELKIFESGTGVTYVDASEPASNIGSLKSASDEILDYDELVETYKDTGYTFEEFLQETVTEEQAEVGLSLVTPNNSELLAAIVMMSSEIRKSADR